MPIENYLHTRCDEFLFIDGEFHRKENKLRVSKLPFHRKEILYFIGGDIVDYRGRITYTGPFKIRVDYMPEINPKYIVVPGIIRGWRSKKTETNLDVSEVEPIRDKKLREKTEKILQEKYGEMPINFW
ncbi:MAG: hypothetical protein J7L08_01130 [Candidatus Aenigmarchaeota archaeon]|nr:hypothetical protein [Candidatus Aenigmarchaeota archaeon]